jgi:hypothetical protein
MSGSGSWRGQRLSPADEAISKELVLAALLRREKVMETNLDGHDDFLLLAGGGEGGGF